MHTPLRSARRPRLLASFAATAFAQQHVGIGHAHIVELDVHVAARRMVGAEHMHRSDHLHAGRVHVDEEARDAAARAEPTTAHSFPALATLSLLAVRRSA